MRMPAKAYVRNADEQIEEKTREGTSKRFRSSSEMLIDSGPRPYRSRRSLRGRMRSSDRRRLADDGGRCRRLDSKCSAGGSGSGREDPEHRPDPPENDDRRRAGRRTCRVIYSCSELVLGELEQCSAWQCNVDMATAKELGVNTSCRSADQESSSAEFVRLAATSRKDTNAASR